MDIGVDIEKCENKTTNIRPESSKRKTKYLDRLISSVREFAQNCTLHGVRYIADKKLTHAERWFWTIVVLTSISICGFLIRNVWVKWESSIIITLNETPVPANSVNYPSLTICPQIKTRINYNDIDAAKDFYYTYYNPPYNAYNNNQNRFEQIADIAQICENEILRSVYYYGIEYDGLKGPLYEHTVNIDNIVDMALDFEDIFESCKWDTYPIPCQSLFRKVLIKEGVCYTTNVLDADKIIRVENGGNKLFLSNRTDVSELDSNEGHLNDSIEGYLNDSFATFEINLREDSEYKSSICNKQNKGFLVYLQDPIDMPKASIRSYTVNTNQIMSLALKFDSVYTSENLRSYPIENRKCYFPDERYLKYFVTYTERNCRMECASNYTEKLCGCVAVYMPHDNKSIICKAYYKNCVNLAETLIFDDIRKKKKQRYFCKEFPKLQNMSDILNKSTFFSNKCHCLPACNTVTYDADIMIIGNDFNSSKDLPCTGLKGCITKRKDYKYARVEWNYKSPSFIGMKRSNTMEMTDVISQCGGLLGLFFGFSFLTLIEIFFYVTLCLGFIKKRKVGSNSK